jgi:hypothetical protein
LCKLTGISISDLTTCIDALMEMYSNTDAYQGSKSLPGIDREKSIGEMKDDKNDHHEDQSGQNNDTKGLIDQTKGSGQVYHDNTPKQPGLIGILYGYDNNHVTK